MAYIKHFTLLIILLLCMYTASCSGDKSSPPTSNADRLLFLAVRQNNVTQAISALDAGANPNLKIEGYALGQSIGRFSLLMIAAQNFEPDIMRLLMDKGADVNVKDQYGRMAIDFLPTKTKVDLIQKMLDKGLNAEGKGRGLVQFSSGNIQISSSGIRPSGFGPTDIIKLLIAHGANVNTKVNSYVNGKAGEGVTALMEAAGSNQIGTVKLLLEDGADPQAMDPDGATALIYAVGESNTIPLLKLLIHHGLNVNAQPKHGENALQTAADHGYFESVKFLLAHGTHVNAKDDSGKTALKYAKAGLAESRINAVATDQNTQTLHDSYVKIIASLKAAGAKN